MKMKPYEINEAIEALMGCDVYQGLVILVEPDHNDEPTIKDHRPCRNFYGDLNACSEMEFFLRGTLEQHFNDPLINRRWEEYQHFIMSRYNGSAPAPVRCEGFLIVMRGCTATP